MGWEDFLNQSEQDIKNSGLSPQDEQSALEMHGNIRARGVPPEFGLLSNIYKKCGYPGAEYPDAYAELHAIEEKYKKMEGKSEWIKIVERRDFWDEYIAVLEKYGIKYKAAGGQGQRAAASGDAFWDGAVDGAKRLKAEFTDPNSQLHKLLSVSQGYKTSGNALAAFDAAAPALFHTDAAGLANNALSGLADEIEKSFGELKRSYYSGRKSGLSVSVSGGSKTFDMPSGELDSELLAFGRSPLGGECYLDYGISGFVQKPMSFRVSGNTRMSVDGTGAMGYLAINKQIGRLETTLGFEAMVFDPANLRAIVGMGAEQMLFCYNVDSIYKGLAGSGAVLFEAGYRAPGFGISGGVRATPAISILHKGKNGGVMAVTPENLGEVSKDSTVALSGAYLAYQLSFSLPNLPGNSAFFATASMSEASQTVTLRAIGPAISLSRKLPDYGPYAENRPRSAMNFYGVLRTELAGRFSEQLRYGELGTQISVPLGKAQYVDINGGIKFDWSRHTGANPDAGPIVKAAFRF